jgi:Ca2+-transporting ATPase
MLAMLLAAGIIYLALGDKTEAVILLLFALLSIAITIVQETRTETCWKPCATFPRRARW